MTYISQRYASCSLALVVGRIKISMALFGPLYSQDGDEIFATILFNSLSFYILTQFGTRQLEKQQGETLQLQKDPCPLHVDARSS